MSWYDLSNQFVQGAGSFGPNFDEDERRRRRHRGGAGAPYEPLLGPAPPAASGAESAMSFSEKSEFLEQAEPSGMTMPQYATPNAPARAMAAVDMGAGPQQPPPLEEFKDDPIEAFGAEYEPPFYGAEPPPVSDYLRVRPDEEKTAPTQELRQGLPTGISQAGVEAALQGPQPRRRAGMEAGQVESVLQQPLPKRVRFAMPQDVTPNAPGMGRPRSQHLGASRPGGHGSSLPQVMEDEAFGAVRRRHRIRGDRGAGQPYDYREVPHRYYGVTGKHEQALRPERDTKFEIPEAEDLRRIAGRPIMPQDVTPTRPPGKTPKPEGPKHEVKPEPAQRPVMPQHVTPSRPVGPLRRARRGRQAAQQAQGRLKEQLRRTQSEMKTMEGLGRGYWQQTEAQKGKIAKLESGRDRARKERNFVLQQAQLKNRSLLDQLGQSTAQTLQLGELAKAKIGQMRSGMWDYHHKQERDQLAREQKMRGRHAEQLGAEKTKAASLQSELQRQKGWAEQEIQTGVGLVASQDLQIEKLRLAGHKLRKQGSDLAAEGNRRLKAAAAELAEALRKLAEAGRAKELSAGEKSTMQADVRRLTERLSQAKREVSRGPAARAPAARAPAAQAPIVVQGGAGGGGASAAGGASSAAGGAPASRQGSAQEVLAAAKQIAAMAKKKPAGAPAKKKAPGDTKGITQARRSYTDKRKAKFAELRALKSKRVREFKAKSKKLPKAARDKQRREFKKNADTQLREVSGRFPNARGVKTVGALRELVRKLDALKAAK